MELDLDAPLFSSGTGTVYAVWLDEVVVERFDVVSCFIEQDLYDKYDIEIFRYTHKDARNHMYDILEGKDIK